MKIILLGDSITQGLGSKKVNFENELQSLLDTDDVIINWALTGTTINYAKELINEIKRESPDIICILYGNVDAQLKPCRTGKIYKRLPKRFNRGEGSMILPRPYYSHVWYKSVGQHFENLLRTIIRKVIYWVDGKEQWVEYNEFRDTYMEVCQSLFEENIAIISCSTVYIDDKLFPGSDSEYIKYNKCMDDISKMMNNIYIDLYTVLKKCVSQGGWNRYYNRDHFHPNGNGYKVIASLLADRITIIKESLTGNENKR